MWERIDGRQITDQQYRIDSTICRGEMNKAGLAAPNADGAGQIIYQDRAMGTVFDGCMAQRGYLQVQSR